MYGKIKITADIHIKTGMHIGGSSAFSAIGSVDNPVIRDPITSQPIIPGSSLKGKLRTLMARNIEQRYILHPPNDDKEEIKRLFGAAGKNIRRGRLQFADCYLKNTEELKAVGYTEVKFENTINRSTSQATPRQIERVVRGAVFSFVLIYDIEKLDEIEEDFSNLSLALRTLQMDYLGGHGSRGYGKVSFRNFSVQPMADCVDKEIADLIEEKLKEVEQDEPFDI
ncbi:MAG: type III-A CRISPR-associated RAMP protein Csm3 [Syntrophomonadaceae bacterium]|nr:type III-A CRISPR-associated RAMP protein Csm3 [Syntrophomonadaceae bacterium]